MADLAPEDLDMAKLVFDIYDADGSGKIDAADLGSALRCLRTNPTECTVKKMGGTDKKGEKSFTLPEFLPIVSQVKKDKDAGALPDFMECFKLYDKNENGTMMSAELAHILMALGERLPEKDVDVVLKFIGEEDEDGFFKYEPWLKIMIAGGPEEYAKQQAAAAAK